MAKLERYRTKRDFDRTPEPAGSAGREGDQPRFVIQQHSARRLHWDLRLEHDGVALSWAVPNGIPDDPHQNRKAVHTEDHPLEYLDFEGDIPAGEYGAGTMRIWDRGTYEPEKVEPRKVIVNFHGERVQGRYALFQTGSDERDWMIHRMDPPADPEREPMPTSVVPMLARIEPFPRDEERYGFEVKWDGVRAIVMNEPGRLRIQGRKLTDVTAQYPEVRALGRALGAREAVLDGEIVALDEQGRPSFERLQTRMHTTSESQIRRRASSTPVTYMIFDLLYLDGRSLMEVPYEERRARLEELELDSKAWRTPRTYYGEGRQLLAASKELGIEGVVAKRRDSLYEPGRRSGAWIKLKNKTSIDLVVGGWVPGEGRRRERIGALLVGYYDGDGVLRYAGRVGSGLSEAALDDLRARLTPLERDDSPFARSRAEGRPRGRGMGPPRGSVFVAPELVVEVEFGEWTRDMVLRHPVYKRLREDRDPSEIVLDGDGLPSGEGSASADGSAGADGSGSGSDASPLADLRPLQGGAFEAQVEGRKLRLTNLDKVLYPKVGFTKGGLIAYLVKVAPVLLPHLRGRPLTLKRYPDGVEGEHFYEKQCPAHRPDWVATEAIYSRRNSRTIDFCLADDLPTLVWLGNLADIELHTSMSLAADIKHPTMVVFDLDPGPPATIVECSRVALIVRELLEQIGLKAFPKTSGSKGMQLYVPLNTPATYDDTKPFAKAVAELLQKQHPELVVARMSKELRPGKVFVDWSQNDEHKTTVCVYSLRAKERPTASTPLTWEEVERCERDGDAGFLEFDHEAVLERVGRDGDLFAETLTLAQELPRFG